MNETKHKAGFVNILGSPNVGKSTLMNALVGENLSIITSKVQTTRHRIMGMLNGDDYQIVFSDTPGIIDKPGYKLHAAMMSYVESALEDADIFLYVTEVNGDTLHESVLSKMQKSNSRIIVLLNKIDLSNQEILEKRVEFWNQQLPNAEILPISALHNFNVDTLRNRLVELIPESPAFYPKDELSDKSMRFFVSEIIREKILLNYKKEIPYSTEVVVEEYKETDNRIDIRATIYVIRETQKMIIIGKNGQAIKRVGIDSRKDIEAFVDKHIYLDITVKVSKDWRENEKQLKKFGYTL
ncbi:MAG: GTPase Era [Bacteroidetes bacterium]|nr:MAG: GTPase Era [Bacteroidota bacterium]